MFHKVFLLSLTIALGVTAALAQAPTPIVVQAVPQPNPKTVSATPANAAGQGAQQMLQDLKAMNAEILKKQSATLLQLDELVKAAEQLKVYSSRG